MMILGLLAFCIFLWALLSNTKNKNELNPAENTDVNPTENTDVNPTENTDVNPTENTDVNSTENTDVNPTENTDVNPTENTDVDNNYEMDPLDAPPIQTIPSEEDYINVEPDSYESIGVPKHLRTGSYEDKKSTLATIFDNVKPKTD